MSIPALLEYVVSSEAEPNAAAPVRNRLLRPIRSPKVPTVTRSPAIIKP